MKLPDIMMIHLAIDQFQMNPKSVFNYNGSAKSIDNVSLYVFVAEVICRNAINSLWLPKNGWDLLIC